MISDLWITTEGKFRALETGDTLYQQLQLSFVTAEEQEEEEKEEEEKVKEETIRSQKAWEKNAGAKMWNEKEGFNQVKMSGIANTDEQGKGNEKQDEFNGWN